MKGFVKFKIGVRRTENWGSPNGEVGFHLCKLSYRCIIIGLQSSLKLTVKIELFQA